MTTLVFPSADRPAVSAKGTVRPSESPIIASEINRARDREVLAAWLCLSSLRRVEEYLSSDSRSEDDDDEFDLALDMER